MLEFVILMVILDMLMKLCSKACGEPDEPETSEVDCTSCYKMGYVCGNTAAWEFKSLEDALEFRDMRVSGWRGDIMDYYREKEEDEAQA